MNYQTQNDQQYQKSQDFFVKNNQVEKKISLLQNKRQLSQQIDQRPKFNSPKPQQKNQQNILDQYVSRVDSVNLDNLMKKSQPINYTAKTTPRDDLNRKMRKNDENFEQNGNIKKLNEINHNHQKVERIRNNSIQGKKVKQNQIVQHKIDKSSTNNTYEKNNQLNSNQPQQRKSKIISQHIRQNFYQQITVGQSGSTLTNITKKNNINQLKSNKKKQINQEQEQIQKVSHQVDISEFKNELSDLTQNEKVFYLYSVQQAYKPPFPKDYESTLYREHFVQMCQGILYGRFSKPQDPQFLEQNFVHLGQNNSKSGKTIIFDLDETLIHCNEGVHMPADAFLDINFSTGEEIKIGINIRPFLNELLTKLNEDFELVVFTASHENYANKVIDHIDPQKKYFKHRFFRNHCVMTQNRVFIKDLRIFKDRKLSDIILIDNAGYSFSYQLANGIPILSFYDNKEDTEFLKLLPYLQSLKDLKDLRSVNKEYFKLHIFGDPAGPKKAFDRLFNQEYKL